MIKAVFFIIHNTKIKKIKKKDLLFKEKKAKKQFLGLVREIRNWKNNGCPILYCIVKV